MSNTSTVSLISSLSFDRTECTPNSQSLLTVLFIIKGFYGTITVIVYFLNVQAMRFTGSKLNKSFRKLYATVAFLSSLYFLEYYLIKQFPTLGWFCDTIWRTFAEPNWIITPTRVIAAYCPIALLIFHFLISLHRLLALVLPTKMRIWDAQFWKIWLLGFLLPLLFMWFVIPCRGYIYVDPLGGLGMEYEDFYIVPNFKFSSTMLSVIAACIFGGMTMLNTVWILILLKTRVKIPEKDCSLVYFEILMAFITLVFAATQTVLYLSKNVIKDDAMKYTVEYIRTYVVDIFILPNAWTLLIFSKNVRKSVRDLLICLVRGRRRTVPVIKINFSHVPSSISKIPSSF